MALTLETLEKAGQGEPDWLREKRRSAFASYETMPMPSRTDEEWRRTDMTGLDPTKFATLEHANGYKQEMP